MGCASSSQAKATGAVVQEEKPKQTPNTSTASNGGTTHNHPSLHKASSDERPLKFLPTTQVTLGRCGTIKYACCSRKGREPDDLRKANQDSYGVHGPPFCKQEQDAFFGVYDGHGAVGHHCSQFVRRHLPTYIETAMHDQFDLVLSTDQIHGALSKAHVECNEALHASKEIDDYYSGTTAISVYVHGQQGQITIANVGDSRAIMGTQAQGNTAIPITPASTTNFALTAFSLSQDQTPKRPEEAQRCIDHGARILSFGQLMPDPDDEGEDEEDPPRVWAQNGRSPGTAFTRSLGDAVAEKLGVHAEPELLTLKLSDKEKIIVLASDGVWDVLSNQHVIDLACQYADPLEACRALVDASHEEWLKNEECTDEEHASYDDMTVICIYLNALWEDIAAATAANAASDEEVDQPQSFQERKKRVRQKTLRNLEEMKSSSQAGPAETNEENKGPPTETNETLNANEKEETK